MIYDGRREGADPCFAGENTLIPMTHIHRYPQVLRHSSLSQTNFDLTAAPECVRLSRSVWFNLRYQKLVALVLTLPACVPGAPAGRHTILPWTKKKDLESTSRRNTEQNLSCLPPLRWLPRQNNNFLASQASKSAAKRILSVPSAVRQSQSRS